MTPADDSWQSLNDFQCRVPVPLTFGEHGEPIARGRLRPLGTVEELDEELDLLDS